MEKPMSLTSGNIYDFAGEVFAQKTITIKTNNVFIKNLTVDGEIRVLADNVTLDGCHAQSICVFGATNALVARCEADSFAIDEAYNCSVILNSAKIIAAGRNTSIYVIDNNVSDKLVLIDNNYIIADGNKAGELCSRDNENVNGNTLTDVDARPEVGSNEDILPHTNKELFVGMPRFTGVANTGLTMTQYTSECAKTSDSIIIPPGAYSAEGTFTLGKDISGKTVYAYGVYYELAETDLSKYPASLLMVNGTADVNVYGIQLGYTLPSSGQVRIVEKTVEDGKYLLRVIPDAGFMDGFTTTNPELYMTWWPEMFFRNEDGTYNYRCDENPKGAHRTTYNYDENGERDGTMTIELLGKGENPYREGKSAQILWNRIPLGTVITCRLAYGNKYSIWVMNSKNVLIRDTVLYGYSSALSVFGGGESENVEFLRYHDTTHSSTLIDKQTYDKYRALEQKWNADFELREEEMPDGSVRYRGAPSRSSSVDAFHVSGSKQGFNITSTLLEGMVDDGNNQHAASSRMHGFHDNGDGTTTIYYKPLVSSVSWWFSEKHPEEDHLGTPQCTPFKAGNRIYAYNPYGKTVCDTLVLDDCIDTEEIDIDLTYGTIHKHIKRTVSSVRVKTCDVDFSALIDPATGKEFDLLDNRFEIVNRITVDNLSYNCTGYTLDNVMVYNGHSRGFLIKAEGVNIKHCTFRNVCYSAILIRPETEWAESTVGRNISIDRCLFDNTGYIFNAITDINQCCIRIQSTSKVASDDTLPIDNIAITNCKFTNNEQRYAIWINSARNVLVKNNVFDAIAGDQLPEEHGVAVTLDTCKNIEISDNVYNYTSYKADVRNVIRGNNYVNIFGNDVTDKDGNAIFPDLTPKA